MSEHTTSEEWRPIYGFKDYEVSSKGRVQNVTTGIILKASGVAKRVTLTPEPYMKHTKMVSRLVAEAFIDDYNEIYEVHHYSGDVSDNRVENLFMSNHKIRGKPRR